MKKKNNELVVKAKGPMTATINEEAHRDRAILQHDGINLHMVVNELIKYEDKILNSMSPKIRDNGFIAVNDNGNGQFIKPVNDCWAASFIPGVAFASAEMDDDFAACMIVNTLNDGFAYAALDEKNRIQAIGPVVTPCIVGNSAKPQGLYIPFNNRNAVESGIAIAIDYIDSINAAEIQKENKNKTPELDW